MEYLKNYPIVKDLFQLKEVSKYPTRYEYILVVCPKCKSMEYTTQKEAKIILENNCLECRISLRILSMTKNLTRSITKKKIK